MGEVTVDDALDRIGIGRFHVMLVIIGSILNAAEAIEIYILSILDPLLRCAWNITSLEAAALTSCVFGGMLLGGPILGLVADFIGRRDALIITTIATTYFGILSGLVPSFGWLVFTRMILGFFLNGMLLVTLTLIQEFTPTRCRGTYLLITFTVWPIGGLILTGVTYLSVSIIGWRGLLIVNSLPLIIPLIGVIFIPRSPRYLLAQGRNEEAERVLDKMSRINGHGGFADHIISPRGVDTSSALKDLGRLRPLLLTLCIICFLNFSIGFIYSGNILIVVLLPETPHKCLQNLTAYSTQKLSEMEDFSCCPHLTSDVYLSIVTSCIGEILSSLLTLPLMERIGRRWTLSINAFIGFPIIIMLGLCQPQWSSILLILLSRALITAFLIVLLIYNAEILPTTIRNTALGICGSFNFIGSLTSPFVAQIMVPAGNGISALFIYGSLFLIAGAVSLMLPLETSKMKLSDTAADAGTNVEQQKERYSLCKDILKTFNDNEVRTSTKYGLVKTE